MTKSSDSVSYKPLTLEEAVKEAEFYASAVAQAFVFAFGRSREHFFFFLALQRHYCKMKLIGRPESTIVACSNPNRRVVNLCLNQRRRRAAAAASSQGACCGSLCPLLLVKIITELLPRSTRTSSSVSRRLHHRCQPLTFLVIFIILVSVVDIFAWRWAHKVL